MMLLKTSEPQQNPGLEVYIEVYPQSMGRAPGEMMVVSRESLQWKSHTQKGQI